VPLIANTLLRKALLAGTLGIASVVAAETLYRRFLRDWVLTWGATEAEVGRRSFRSRSLGASAVISLSASVKVSGYSTRSHLGMVDGTERA